MDLDGLLVSLGFALMARLVDLVTKGVLGSGGTVREGCQQWISKINLDRSLPSAEGSVAVLGDLLVGLLGNTRSGLLDLVGDEVTGLLERIHCERLVVELFVCYC